MEHEKVEAFVNKAEITELLNRYFRALDQKDFDATTMHLIFADNARIVRPNGAETIGPQPIGESHRKSFVRFRATQHMTGGVIVTLHDHGQAEFRGNLVAMHLWAEGLGDPTSHPNDNYFLAGGVLSGKAVMTSQGWRITQLSNDVIWRKGTGFQQILQTQ
ncbi:MAG: nuclear transport factor 2 family protein [Caldilineaceae bacterium]